MRILLAFGFIICIGLQSFAQTTACTRRLVLAEEAFDQGRLQDVLDALGKEKKDARDCFSNFTTEERIRAEKLLTKVYIFTDNVPEAESALIDLLHVDKEHQLAKDDPSELHFLYSQFKTEPIFRVAARLSANKSMPVIIQPFNTFQGGSKKYNGADGADTGLGIGFSGEILVERHIKNGIEVGIGAQYRIASYEVEGNLLNDTEKQLFYKVKNQSNMLRIPVLGRYNFNYDKKDAEGLRLKKMFYVFGGASFDIVTSAKYINTDRTGGTAFTLNDNNDLTGEFDQVASTNASIFGGVGLRMRMGREQVDFLSFEIRYDNSLFNYIKSENRYANKSVNFDIGHVEDDLALNTISISVGYTRSIYKPSKRKQYR
ncbi:MAG: outer membrane beta-barrel protein [Cyclobacteriaceae bacterium]